MRKRNGMPLFVFEFGHFGNNFMPEKDCDYESEKSKIPSVIVEIVLVFGRFYILLCKVK